LSEVANQTPACCPIAQATDPHSSITTGQSEQVRRNVARLITFHVQSAMTDPCVTCVRMRVIGTTWRN